MFAREWRALPCRSKWISNLFFGPYFSNQAKCLRERETYLHIIFMLEVSSTQNISSRRFLYFKYLRVSSLSHFTFPLAILAPELIYLGENFLSSVRAQAVRIVMYLLWEHSLQIRLQAWNQVEIMSEYTILRNLQSKSKGQLNQEGSHFPSKTVINTHVLICGGSWAYLYGLITTTTRRWRN
jgi:hypothetical protein